MSSECLFTKCKVCGKEIAKSAKNCPQCGAKIKKTKVIYLILIGFLGLMVIGIASQETKNKPDSSSDQKRTVASISSVKAESFDPKIPEDQIMFIKAVNDNALRFKGSQNELQQSVARDQRRTDISAVLRGYYVSSWVGTIVKLETNSEGKAILSVKISPNVIVKTYNNSFSDLNLGTLIEKESSVYNSLFNLSKGQKIIFSGSFFPSEVDFAKETSMTIDGSMNDPEFLFKFRSVTSIR